MLRRPPMSPRTATLFPCTTLFRATRQASLAIEQNTLSVEQVTAVLAGKPVLGSPKEIQEVRNAFAAYEAMEHWQPHRSGDLLQAHGLLMAGLVDRPGR